MFKPDVASSSSPNSRRDSNWPPGDSPQRILQSTFEIPTIAAQKYTTLELRNSLSLALAHLQSITDTYLVEHLHRPNTKPLSLVSLATIGYAKEV